MAGVIWREMNRRNRRLVIAPEVRRIAEGIAADAAANTPRDTGTAAGGWTTEPGRDPGTTLVVNQVPYIRHVEYDTRRRGGAAAPLGRALAAARRRM